MSIAEDRIQDLARIAFDAYGASTGGKTWGAPFQRSTVVMYWNKDLFKEAGLDPAKPPRTWAELADAAKKLNPINRRYEPVGTNLFSYTQAEAMVRHMLGGDS